MIQHFAQFLRDDRFGPMHQRAPEHSVFGLVMCILWLIIVVAVIFAVYKLISNHDHGVLHKDPIDIAKERFAKGEISKTELAEIKKELKN